MASLSLPTTALALALALAATCGTAVGQSPWVPEIQTVNVVAEGGTFWLLLFGGETPLLPFDAGAGDVRAAINSLGSTSPTPGGPLAVAVERAAIDGGYSYTVTFPAALGHVPLFWVKGDTLTGEGATATVVETQRGYAEPPVPFGVPVAVLMVRAPADAVGSYGLLVNGVRTADIMLSALDVDIASAIKAAHQSLLTTEVQLRFVFGTTSYFRIAFPGGQPQPRVAVDTFGLPEGVSIDIFRVEELPPRCAETLPTIRATADNVLVTNACPLPLDSDLVCIEGPSVVTLKGIPYYAVGEKPNAQAGLNAYLPTVHGASECVAPPV